MYLLLLSKYGEKMDNVYKRVVLDISNLESRKLGEFEKFIKIRHGKLFPTGEASIPPYVEGELRELCRKEDVNYKISNGFKEYDG